MKTKVKKVVTIGDKSFIRISSDPRWENQIEIHMRQAGTYAGPVTMWPNKRQIKRLIAALQSALAKLEEKE